MPAMIPSPGAANAVVPKNGMGMAFWIAGVPGRADMVKVKAPSAIVPGISRFGIFGVAKQRRGDRENGEGDDERRDAAVGQHRAAQHHRDDRALAAPARR